MVFCNIRYKHPPPRVIMVTILILIDGFLQSKVLANHKKRVICHNPYFNRWFSAIKGLTKAEKTELKVTILILIDGFLQ